MKLNARHVTILILLAIASVLFGLAYNGIAGAIERRRYPQPERYRDAIVSAASESGVPEAILWALARTESGFDSSLQSADGGIGLLRITPERFSDIAGRLLDGESDDPARLYDPLTNLRAGSALLSDLYDRYGDWKTVYAAWHAGTDRVDEWLADSRNTGTRGELKSIPDPGTASFAATAQKAAERYAALYYK